jgi:hypothetical protein
MTIDPSRNYSRVDEITVRYRDETIGNLPLIILQRPQSCMLLALVALRTSGASSRKTRPEASDKPLNSSNGPSTQHCTSAHLWSRLVASNELPF